MEEFSGVKEYILPGDAEENEGVRERHVLCPSPGRGRGDRAYARWIGPALHFRLRRTNDCTPHYPFKRFPLLSFGPTKTPLPAKRAPFRGGHNVFCPSLEGKGTVRMHGGWVQYYTLAFVVQTIEALSPHHTQKPSADRRSRFFHSILISFTLPVPVSPLRQWLPVIWSSST